MCAGSNMTKKIILEVHRVGKGEVVGTGKEGREVRLFRIKFRPGWSSHLRQL